MNTGQSQQRSITVQKVRETDASPLMKKESLFCGSPSPSPSVTPMKTRSHLYGMNVIKRNAIIVTGIDSNIDADSCRSKFGKYGKICKCVLNPSSYYEFKPRDPDENVAYIAYISEKGATNAVRNASNQFDETRMKVSFFVTKYCDKFISGDYCEDRDCLSLHEVLHEHTCVETNEPGKKFLSPVELTEEKSLSCYEEPSDLITRNLLYMNSYAIKDSSKSIPPQKNFDASVGGCKKLKQSSSIPGYDNPFAFQSPLVMTKQNFIFKTKNFTYTQRRSQMDPKGSPADSNCKSYYNLPTHRKAIENFQYASSKHNFLSHHHIENQHQNLHFHGYQPRFYPNSNSYHSQFKHPMYHQRGYGQMYDRQLSSRTRAESSGYYYRNNLLLNLNNNIPSWNKDALNRNCALRNLKMY